MLQQRAEERCWREGRPTPDGDGRGVFFRRRIALRISFSISLWLSRIARESAVLLEVQFCVPSGKRDPPAAGNKGIELSTIEKFRGDFLRLYFVCEDLEYTGNFEA